jgi:isopenicillin N synthase-like dioxygenase
MDLARLAQPMVWQEFRRTGFLRIPSVIDPEKVSAIRDEAYRVFHDIGAINPRAYRGRERSGFTPTGIEGVAGNRADYGRQFWDVHLDRESDRKTCLHSEKLVRKMQTMTHELSLVMADVFFWMENGLGPQGRGLYTAMLKGSHGLRATHYPAALAPPDDILFPAHRDFSLVTVFVGGAEPGLQIDQAGSWAELVNPAGDIILIAGGMLRYWTGGPKDPNRVGGLRHRVMHRSGERLSFSFFTEPEPSTILPFSDGNTAGEYISRFIAATRTAR